MHCRAALAPQRYIAAGREDRPLVDDELPERVVEILKVPSGLIENFDEEQAIFNIQNNYEDANLPLHRMFRRTYDSNDKWHL